jgi:hypothetical protein
MEWLALAVISGEKTRQFTSKAMTQLRSEFVTAYTAKYCIPVYVHGRFQYQLVCMYLTVMIYWEKSILPISVAILYLHVISGTICSKTHYLHVMFR